MASKLKQAAAEKLARQAAGDFGYGTTKADKYAAIQPDAAAYNVFAPQYAASLAASTGTPAADILNQRALGVNAETESERYMAALAAANENQKYLQHAAAVAEINAKVADHDLDPSINKTIGSVSSDGKGYLTYDQPAVAVMNSENLNTQHAGTLKDTAGAVKDLGAAGYLLPPDVVGAMTTPAGQETPNQVKENYTPITLDNGQVVEMLPGDVNEYIKALNDGRKADAAMIAARAAEYRAKHPTSGGPVTTVTFDPEGHKVQTQVKVPGADTDQYLPNPKADVRSSGTSAKPSAAKLPAIDLAPIKDIGSQFGTVTSTTRSKKHNADVGGVKNSYHIDYGNGGHAIDIARKKGVHHQDIVAAYKNAGYKIAEQLDEGDHTHIGFVSGPVQQHASGSIPQQRRPVPGGLDRVVQLAQAKGYPVKITAQGVVVQFPNGKTRTYGQ